MPSDKTHRDGNKRLIRDHGREATRRRDMAHKGLIRDYGLSLKAASLFKQSQILVGDLKNRSVEELQAAHGGKRKLWEEILLKMVGRLPS